MHLDIPYSIPNLLRLNVILMVRKNRSKFTQLGMGGKVATPSTLSVSNKGLYETHGNGDGNVRMM